MRNLLPENKKSLVNREYFLRVVVAVMWPCFFVVIVGIALIIPSLLVVQSQVEALSSREGLIEQTIVVRENDVSVDKLKEAKHHVKHLKCAKDDTKLTDLMVSIINSAPKNINLTGFDYDQKLIDSKEEKNASEKKKKMNEMQISGIAKNRNSLTYFSESLKSLEKVKEVNLPISQFAQGSNISFSLTLKGDF